MNLFFIFVQAIGFIAWVILILSYYKKDTNGILIMQIIATILYCIHYMLLGAYSGLFICMFEVIRDYSYYKTDKDDYIFIGSIPVYIIGGIFSVKSFVDLLPILSSIIDGYSFTKKKKFIIFCAVISYASWVIYDILVKSYSCAITDGIIAVSNLSILLFNRSIGIKKVVE